MQLGRDLERTWAAVGCSGVASWSPKAEPGGRGGTRVYSALIFPLTTADMCMSLQLNQWLLPARDGTSALPAPCPPPSVPLSLPVAEYKQEASAYSKKGNKRRKQGKDDRRAKRENTNTECHKPQLRKSVPAAKARACAGSPRELFS